MNFAFLPALLFAAAAAAGEPDCSYVAENRKRVNYPERMPVRKKRVVVAVVDSGIRKNPCSRPPLASRIGSYPVFLEHGSVVADIITSVDPWSNILDAHTPYLTGKLGGVKDTVYDISLAFSWALAQGADIINYSIEGPGPFRHELMAFAAAAKLGVLVVVAGGNNRELLDGSLKNGFSYPSEYRLPNVLAVASDVASSNIGPGTLHLTAPGRANVFVDGKGRKVSDHQGTSMAAAYASAAASVVMSAHPSLGPREVIRLLMDSSRFDPLLSHLSSAGRLDLGRALVLARIKASGLDEDGSVYREMVAKWKKEDSLPKIMREAPSGANVPYIKAGGGT